MFEREFKIFSKIFLKLLIKYKRNEFLICLRTHFRFNSAKNSLISISLSANLRASERMHVTDKPALKSIVVMKSASV